MDACLPPARGGVSGLAALLGDFGERWAITPIEDDDGYWLIATPRPHDPRGKRFVRRTAGEMREVLAAEEQRTGVR